MDMPAWIELGKIIAAVGSAIVALAGISGYIWRHLRRKARELAASRDKANELEVKLHKSVVERNHLREVAQGLKDQLADLQARQAKTRAQWKANVTDYRRKIDIAHQSVVDRKDQEIGKLAMGVAEKSQLAGDLGKQLDDANAALRAAQAALEERIRESNETRAQVEHRKSTELGLTQQLEDSQHHIDELERSALLLRRERGEFALRLDAAETRIQSLLTWDGRLWNRPIPADAPKFRPLKNRKMPIVSVLNFKGGVGKTSITANLAGFVGRQGRHTLMIDLDYQRSLSQLVLPIRIRKTLQLEGRCWQHFLAGERHDTSRLLELAHRIEHGMDRCSIVINSHAFEIRRREDSLEETENQRMAEWIIKRESMRDIRFFLREGLHGLGVESHFDYVLLDCPPRITTSTINALAASDFVLVPVVLDEISSSSVAPLVSSLRSLRELFPALQMLGIVANQAKLYNGAPVQREQAIWDNLQAECGKIFKDYPIRFFETVVPLHKAFGENSDEQRAYLAIDDETIGGVFKDLTAEIQKEIETHEHSHSATVLV